MENFPHPSEVLTPRDGDEGLQVAAGIDQIAKQILAYGAFPSVEDSHLVHRHQEIAVTASGRKMSGG